MTHAYPIPTNNGHLLHNAKEAIEYVSRYCENCVQNNTLHSCSGAQAAECNTYKEQIIQMVNNIETASKQTPLNFYNCLRLLHECVKHGLIQASPRNKDCILVYREAGTESPEGWYEENVHDSARELMVDIDDQKFLIERLKQRKGVEFAKEPLPNIDAFFDNK